MERIPLNESSYHRNGELNTSSSLLLDSPYTESTTIPITGTSRSRHKTSFRGRQSSVYVKRSRFSRYKNAAASAIPIRLVDTPNDHIPLDSIGCCSSSSFFWTRKFLKHNNEIEGEALSIPDASKFDGAEINAKRFLGKFKDNVQKCGTSKLSMMKVVFQFCCTRLIFATIFHIFAVMFEILAPTLFLKLFFDAIHVYPFLELQEELFENQVMNSNQDDDTEILDMPKRHLLIFALLGFGFSIPIATFFKFMTTSFNLRTANRLRTAIISSMFKKALKSRVNYNIAVHQIMTFTTEDGEYIFNLIEKGTLVTGILFGVILASIASIVLLGFPGIWPLFVIFPLFVIITFMAKISTQYNLRAECANAKKLTIIEELLSNYRNIKMLGFHKVFKSDFVQILRTQCRLLTWSEIFNSKASGHVTSAMLLGGLYLNWCDFMIETNIIEVLVLVILFAYLVKIYMVQFSEGLQTIMDASGCLEKVKEAFTLEIGNPSKSKPKKDIFVSIENALFAWPTKEEPTLKIDSDFYLRVEEFYVRKCDIVGVVGPSGSGKSMFAYSILGQTIDKHGDIRIKDKIEYYPTDPFILQGTIKENIIMGGEFDSQKFYNAVVDTKLDKDVLIAVGAEDLDIMSMDLKPHQLQRIVLARALYSDATGFIFDEPFRNIRKSPGLVKLVKNVLFKLQIQEKTVILISTTEQFLSTCQFIHFIDNGQLISDTGTRGTYESFIELPEYQDVLKNENFLEQSCGFQEQFEGARLDGLCTKKRAVKEFDISEDNLNVSTKKNYSPKYSPMSYWRILILYLFLSLSFLGYYILPVAFIQYHDYKDPWLAYGCIGIILVSIILDLFTKIFYATACEIKAREHQIPLFEKLINTSINFLQTTQLTDITCMFMSTNLLDETAVFVDQMNGHIGMTFAMVALGLANYWNCIAFVIHFLLMILLILKFKTSIGYYTKCELETMAKIFQTGNNLITGRGVLQSLNVENYPNIYKKLFTAIENNSTSIFLQKSFVYHTKFVNQLLLWVHFMATCVIMILTPPSKDMIFNQALGLFGLFSYSFYTDKFLEALLNVQRYAEQDKKMNQDLELIETFKEKKSPKKPLVIYRGVSIKLTELKFKIAIRDLLNLDFLEVEPGAKIGLFGDGANLVSSLLSKLISQTSGEIKLNDSYINEYFNSDFLFGFVPFDPKIDGVTISMLLDPEGTYQNKNNVQSALRSARMWEYVSKLPRVLDEPIMNLPRHRRQQLSLARCFVKKNRVEKLIIVIEFPHPELIPILELCLRNELSDNAVIIITEIDHQLKLCDTYFETHDLFSDHELEVLDSQTG